MNKGSRLTPSDRARLRLARLHVPEDITRIMRGIRTAGHVAVVPHARPDIDAMGSALALCHAISEQFPQAKAFVFADEVPASVGFLPGMQRFVIQAGESKAAAIFNQCDLIIVCDTQEPALLGAWRQSVLAASASVPVIIIDHHPRKDKFEREWIDTGASSTAEMLTRLFCALKWGISPDAANCLAAGIISDTSHFTNANSTTQALDTTIYLIRQGADLNRLSTYLDSIGRVAKVQAWGQTLSGIEQRFGGQYVWAIVPMAVRSQYDIVEAEIEGLSNYLRSIEGVKIAAVFIERGPTEIRISFRSVQGYDVNALARQYPSGGGHPVAAGCVLEMPLDVAIMDVEERIGVMLGALATTDKRPGLVL